MNNPDIKIAHINTAEKLKNPIDKALVHEVVQRNVNQTLKTISGFNKNGSIELIKCLMISIHI